LRIKYRFGKKVDKRLESVEAKEPELLRWLA
jgi:hypothetical protein